MSCNCSGSSHPDCGKIVKVYIRGLQGARGERGERGEKGEKGDPAEVEDLPGDEPSLVSQFESSLE